MAKPKKQEEKKSNWKDLRIQANAAKRAAKHGKRMAKQAACPKRGTARALRRYCDGISREFPSVLKGRYTMSMLFRSKPKAKAKPNVGLLLINGKPMGSMAEALFTVRELAAQRKATLASTAAR